MNLQKRQKCDKTIKIKKKDKSTKNYCHFQLFDIDLYTITFVLSWKRVEKLIS